MSAQDHANPDQGDLATDELTVRAMAEHVLRTREIDRGYGRLHGLDESAARRAVAALAAAGLLAARPRYDVPEELTAERAELLVRRGLAGGQDRIAVAEAGALRLEWTTAIRGYRLADHTGEHYRGGDHAEAAAEYNRIAGQDAAAGAAVSG